MLNTLKKAISILLCITSCIACSAVYSSAAVGSPSDGAFVFDSTSSVRSITGGHSLDISYNDNEDAAQLRVNSSAADPDPYFSLDLSSANLTADMFRYILMIYKTPSTNSAKAKNCEIFPCAGAVQGPTGGYSHIFALNTGSGYSQAVIDLSSLSWWSGSIHNIRIDPFCAAAEGDTMYLDSVILCKSKDEADNIAKERISVKSGTNPYIGSDYICTAYDVTKYTSPLWKGDIVYNEAVYPVMDAEGNAVYTLMYTPDKVLSLYSSNFNSYYVDGINYKVEGNKLTLLKTGSIPLVKYSYIHRTQGDGYRRTAAGDGMFEYWGQSPEFFDGYLNITYTHSDTWNGPVPESKTDKLPRTAAAIENKDKLNIVYFGDSICGGANSSSYRNVYPYAEWWNEQITSKLTKDYGCKVNATYSSVGGSTATGMVSSVQDSVIKYSPDLVFIEYGANDAMEASQNSDYSASRLKSEFKNGIRQMIDKIRDSLPNCEIVLVAPFYCNIYCHYQSYFDACRDALVELEASYSGVAVADITTMHKYLLSFKDYLDMSGDNMCHPNDFMSRVFSQVCLEAIVPGGVSAYVPEGELPDISTPTVKPSRNYSYSSPDGHGWYWPQAEAYGYIKGYGTNSQNIILDFDLCLLPSNEENPSMAKLWTSDGSNIFITTDHISIGDKTASYNWGRTSAANWHTVSITIKSGAAAVAVDGETIVSVPEGITVYTDHQLLFSQHGSMIIDNISMRSDRGNIYFNCDFEDRNKAQSLFGDGMGQYFEISAGTVHYELCGGTGDIPNQIKLDGTPLIITDKVPERKGFTFVGWSDDSTATNVSYRADDLYTADGSAVLYAVWKSDTVQPEVESITPINAEIKESGSITYTMIASGGTLTYQWQCISDNADKMTIIGQNSQSLTVSVDTPVQGDFRAVFICTVTNEFGLSATSYEVYLDYTGISTAGILGDINGDGIINVKDSNMLKRIISGSYMPDADEFIRADIEKDNRINTKDSYALKRMILGIQ